MKKYDLCVLLSSLAVGFSTTAIAQPVITAPPDTAQVRLTIPQSGSALVRDRRTVNLPAGKTLVRFPGVAAQLDANSVQPVISGGKINVLEQRFRHDKNITEQSILRRYIGTVVTLQRVDQPAVKGTLLLTEGVLLLDTADGLLVNPQGTFLVPRLTDPIATEPFLEWNIDAPAPGAYGIEARYATTGLTWQANYRALFNTAGDRMSLNAWLTISNSSGADFRQAQISLSEYPGIKINQPVDLLRGESRQLSYFAGDEITVTPEFIFYDMGSNRDFTKSHQASPQIMVRLPNTKEAGLGFDLLPGQLDVWRTENDGSLQRLSQSPLSVVDSRLWIPRGLASSLTVTRSAAATRQLNPVTKEHTIQITVGNRSSIEHTVSVVERLPYNAKLTESSTKPVMIEDNLTEFKVIVPADGTATVKYVVEVKN